MRERTAQRARSARQRRYSARLAVIFGSAALRREILDNCMLGTEMEHQHLSQMKA